MMNKPINHIELTEQAIRQIDRGLYDTEAAAGELCDLYAGLSGHVKQIQKLQKQIKQMLSDIIAETGQVEWSGEIGRCYVPKPSISIRYDAKALDVLCCGNNELAAQLAPFRIETERAGSLTIR